MRVLRIGDRYLTDVRGVIENGLLLICRSQSLPRGIRSAYMDKRYTVFVSSTYADLKEERDAVIRTIMEAGHIPLGMEAFGAANASQWDIITDTIDGADYYVLILGARYGSIDESTKQSFTEMEFDYAVSRGVPCLVLAMAEGVPVDPKFVDNPEKQSAFKAKAMNNRQSAFWRNSDDLGAKVLKALSAEFRRSPRDGWVRPSPVAGPGVAEELARLSQENATLKQQLASFDDAREFQKYDAALAKKTFEHGTVKKDGNQVFELIASELSTRPLEYSDVSVVVERAFKIGRESSSGKAMASMILDFYAKIGLIKSEVIGKTPLRSIPIASGAFTTVGGELQSVYALTEQGRNYVAHMALNQLI